VPTVEETETLWLARLVSNQKMSGEHQFTSMKTRVALALSGLDYPYFRGNNWPPERELLRGEHVVFCVKGRFRTAGVGFLICRLLGDRRGAEARLPRGDDSRSSTMACNIAIAVALLAKDVRV
jgi:hypothetical protein